MKPSELIHALFGGKRPYTPMPALDDPAPDSVAAPAPGPSSLPHYKIVKHTRGDGSEVFLAHRVYPGFGNMWGCGGILGDDGNTEFTTRDAAMAAIEKHKARSIVKTEEEIVP